VEPVVTLPWNGWKVSRGITGKFAVEYPIVARKWIHRENAHQVTGRDSKNGNWQVPYRLGIDNFIQYPFVIPRDTAMPLAYQLVKPFQMYL
jgi:hypothetical protein